MVDATMARSRLARTKPGGALVGAVILVPLALAGVSTTVSRGSIQDDLKARADAALHAAGIAGVTTDFSGRDATVKFPLDAPVSLRTKAEDIVKAIDGVRSVSDAGGHLVPGPAGPDDQGSGGTK